MKCNQCARPALYQQGDGGPLFCVDCFHKLQSIANMQFLMNAALANQALDDLDAAVGIYTSGGRIPVGPIANAMRGKTMLNHIRVSNSTVGSINTGDLSGLARIDAVITLSKDSDKEEIGLVLKILTQAVVDARELLPTAKKEVLDLIQALSEQVVGLQGEPKPSVIKSLMDSLDKKIGTLAGVAQHCQTLLSMLAKFFGL